MQHVQQLLTTVDVELRVNVLRVRAHGVLADDQAPTARNSMGSAVTVPFAASDLNSVPVAASSVRPST